MIWAPNARGDDGALRDLFAGTSSGLYLRCVSGRAENSQGDAPDTSRKRDVTPLFLGVFGALGLAVAIVVLWIIFGTPSNERAGSSEEKKDRKSLSREELTVILADDDANETEGRSESKDRDRDGDRDTNRESKSSPPPRRPHVEGTREGSTTQETPERPKEAGNRD